MSSSAVPNLGPVSVNDIPKKDAKTERAKPTKTLPTDRMNPAKQLDMLRAYAAASGKGSRHVPISEIAEIMKLAVSTISMAHPFFTSIGLLQRTDAGMYAPSSDVIAFLNAYEWNPEKASHKLGPAFRDAWFGQALISRIMYAPIEEEAALQILAEASAAAPEYKNQLRTLLDLMAACGVIEKDGGSIKYAKSLNQPETAVHEVTRMEPIADAEPRATRVTTSYAQAPEGGVQFNVNVTVDMAEFANWRPERITAFFGGIAQVLAAKANVEKGGAQGS